MPNTYVITSAANTGNNQVTITGTVNSTPVTIVIPASILFSAVSANVIQTMQALEALIAPLMLAAVPPPPPPALTTLIQNLGTFTQ